MRFLERFRRKSTTESQTGSFLLYVLGSRGLTATAAEIETALGRAAQRKLEVKIAYPEQMTSLGPNYELCNAEIECTGLDTYRLNVSALLMSWDAHIRPDEGFDKSAVSNIAARARCHIAATELARAKGMPDRGMKPGDKAWVA